MAKNPIVSVIIPTYNRAGMIPVAIESVLGQTFQQFEIVVVDDGSEDDTEGIAKRYGDRIRYIKIGHRGQSHARNIGMRASRGEFIAFLDSDDSYYPYKLEAQLKLFEKHPELGMIWSEVSAEFPDGRREAYHLRQYHPIYEKNALIFDDIFSSKGAVHIEGCNRTVEYFTGNIFDFCILGTLVMSNTILFKRHLLDSIGYQNEAYRLAEDYEFVLRICKHSPVGFLNIPTYTLRYHDNQISRFLTDRKKNRKQRIEGKVEAYVVMLAAVSQLAAKDRKYYDAHRKLVTDRLSELCKEIGYLYIESGRRRQAVPYLRRAYELEGNKLFKIKSLLVPWISEMTRIGRRIWQSA